MSAGKPVVKMIREEGKPDRCQVRVDGVLVFDGVSLDGALPQDPPAQPDQTAPPPAPRLQPYVDPLTLEANGVLVDFYITQINYSSGEIRFEAQDMPSLVNSRQITVSGN